MKTFFTSTFIVLFSINALAEGRPYYPPTWKYQDPEVIKQLEEFEKELAAGSQRTSSFISQGVSGLEKDMSEKIKTTTESTRGEIKKTFEEIEKAEREAAEQEKIVMAELKELEKIEIKFNEQTPKQTAALIKKLDQLVSQVQTLEKKCSSKDLSDCEKQKCNLQADILLSEIELTIAQLPPEIAASLR